MRRITLFLIVLFYFLFISSKINAQVVINEFYSYESSGDWVELYAIEDATISGWILRDTATSKMATIPQSVSIGPSNSSKFYVVNVGDRLNKDGDVIKLLKQDDFTLIDQISYGTQGDICAPSQGQSVGRYPDANSTIDRFISMTQGVSNNESTFNPCPTPIPSPTQSPSQTPSPTSTTTPAPTPTKSPTSYPTPTKSPTPKPKETVVATQSATPTEQVLGIETSSPTPKEKEEEKIRFPFLAVGLVIIGLAFITFAVFSIIKSVKKSYTGGDEGKNS